LSIDVSEGPRAHSRTLAVLGFDGFGQLLERDAQRLGDLPDGRPPRRGCRGSPPLPFAQPGKGSASPIWNMQIIEVPGLAEPTLIDPALLGVLYVATGTLLVDI
jgi:hypothetical protein